MLKSKFEHLHDQLKRLKSLPHLVDKIAFKNPFADVHFHNWQYFNEAEFAEWWELQIGCYQYRVCKKCGKVQYCQGHCLRLKPPKYVHEWYDIDIVRPHFEMKNGVWSINIRKSKRVDEINQGCN